jgi:hypothetical protein
MEKDIAALLSVSSFVDFQVITADFSRPDGFYIEVPAAGGTVIGKTWGGTAFSATFAGGYHKIKLKSVTFTGSVAGIKALW